MHWKLKVSNIGAAFSRSFALMSTITERVTKMIMTPRANLRGFKRVVKRMMTMVKGPTGAFCSI